MKKIKKNRIVLFLVVSFCIPFSLAAEGADLASVSKNIYNDIFLAIINLLMTASIVFFAWSILKFLFSDADKKEEAKDTLLWGIIALFVMFSFWGILRIINNTFTKDELGKNKPYDFESEYKKFIMPSK